MRINVSAAKTHRNYYFTKSIKTAIPVISFMFFLGLTNIGFTQGNSPEVQQKTSVNSIVVSGEKQDKTLKETISSVSVIEEDAFRKTQYQNIRDAIAAIPNLVTQSGKVPNIRGVNGSGAAGGFNGVSGGANARVSTLIDGISEPFVAVFSGDSGLWDIEQVEVYRGPQSTNNGKNSIGGAVYVKTKDPSFDWEGAVRLGYRNQESYFDKAFMLSGPMIKDTLAFRVSGQIVDGETINDSDEYPSNPADYDLNEFDSTRSRTKLLWTPTDQFKALLTYSTNKEEGDGGRRYYTGDNPWKFKEISNLDMKVESDTLSLKMDYLINNNTSMDILLGAMDYEYGFDTYEASPSREQETKIEEESKTIDSKINFGKNNPDFNGYIGFAYFKREQDIGSKGLSTYKGDDTSDSKAVYGEVNYALTDNFSLTGGVRYQSETQERNFVYAPISAKLDETNNIFLPKLALQYDLTDNTRLGLSGRRGYNSPGGALNFFTRNYYYYDEETVNTYEISSRSSFYDNRLTIRANIFYNDYEGYQALSGGTIVNLDEVVTYGAEIETTAFVSNNLELNMGIGLLQSDIKESGSNFPGIDGNELSVTPKSTLTMGSTYYLTNNFNFGGNIRYVSGYYGDLNNSKETRAGGYSIMNLNAAYETGSWMISAYVNNLADRKAVKLKGTPMRGFFPHGYADIVEPRTIGVSVTYSFF